MSRLLTALSRLPAGESHLTQEQTNWLRRELLAEGLAADAHTGIAQVWTLHIEGDLDEQARAVIELPLKGCGRVELLRGHQHIDESGEYGQFEEITQEAPHRRSNGGRAIAGDLLNQLNTIKNKREPRR